MLQRLDALTALQQLEAAKLELTAAAQRQEEETARRAGTTSASRVPANSRTSTSVHDVQLLF